jgi:hypothetical protein
LTEPSTRSQTTHSHVGHNEYGSTVEGSRCAHPGCEVNLCQPGRAPFSFQCEGCGGRFCAEHRITLDGLPFCLACAISEVESQEPNCECRQTDVDLFDARGCELHDSSSPWNLRMRAVRAIQEYEQTKENYELVKRQGRRDERAGRR